MYIQQNHPPFLAGVGGGVVARVVSAVVAEVACVVLAVVACVVLACVVVLVAVGCFAVAVVVLVDFYKKYLDFTCVHFQNLCICTLPCFSCCMGAFVFVVHPCCRWEIGETCVHTSWI